jgi:hypothetical protein
MHLSFIDKIIRVIYQSAKLFTRVGVLAVLDEKEAVNAERAASDLSIQPLNQLSGVQIRARSYDDRVLRNPSSMARSSSSAHMYP